MGDDHQFCLRWNNHQATLVSVFDTLLEKGVHVDCTLAAEGQTLKAHKVVLSACSPYFEAVLGQQYDKHPIIILKDVKFAELRAMMDYMYRGEVNISQEQLGALLKAAESLQIKGLSDSKPPPPPQPTGLPDVSPSVPCKLGSVRTVSPPRDGSREGSVSPTRRKRKKRRTSISPTPLLLNNNPPTPPDTHHDQMAKIKLLTPKDESETSPPVAVEPPNDCATLEPKPESGDDVRDDPAEDLTLDEGAYSDVEHNGPGTSQSLPDMSAQGYGWHVDRSQDDISIGQEGPRDSTGAQVDIPVIDLDLEASFLNDSDNGSIPGTEMEINPMFSLLQACPQMEPILSEKAPIAATATLAKKMLHETFLQNNNFITKHENVGKFIPKCESEDAEIDDLDDIVLPDESEVFGVGNMGVVDEAVRRSRGRASGNEPLQQFICRHCGKRYRWKSTLRRHESVECGGKPPAHACPYCMYRAKQRGNLGVHIRKHHNAEWNIFANTKLRKSKKIDM